MRRPLPDGPRSILRQPRLIRTRLAQESDLIELKDPHGGEGGVHKKGKCPHLPVSFFDNLQENAPFKRAGEQNNITTTDGMKRREGWLGTPSNI